MKRKLIPLLVLLFSAGFFLTYGPAQAAAKKELIGKSTIGWYLASTEDRLVNYGPEYYEKYFLVMTFFPAAFTPV
jgi:hypothetical protein